MYSGESTFLFWLYYLKCFRLYYLYRVSEAVETFVYKFGGATICGYKNTQRQTLVVVTRMTNLFFSVISILHILACIWIWIGTANYLLVDREDKPPTWIYHPENGINEAQEGDASSHTIYITSLYWVVTTLTTVGYGDQKGYTSTEYIFTYIVEFMGILLFAIILSSTEEILNDDSNSETGDIVE